jgi:molybdate transport system substrate-binding protein
MFAIGGRRAGYSVSDNRKEECVALPTEIKVLGSTAMKAVFEALAPQFEAKTGHRIAVTLGPSARLEKLIAEGEIADVAILAAAGAKDLAAQGKITAGSVTDLARSRIGIAVTKGAPKPDISSAESFKRVLLAAKAIAVSKPTGGGQSGAHMAKVFEQLGIADTVQAKAKYGAGGAAGLAGLVLLRGEADIGIQQMSELMAVDGIDIVGPLPDELQSVTLFTASIPANAKHPEAARVFIDLLVTPEAKSVIKAKGLEPA